MTTTAPTTDRRASATRVRAWPSARLRISGWYLLLVGFSLLVTLVTMRQVLHYQVDRRTAEALRQEAEEFGRLVEAQNPATGETYRNDIAALFDAFLARNVPATDEVVLTLLGGRPYKLTAEPAARIDQDTQAVGRWASLSRTEEGTIRTAAGSASFLAVPLVSPSGIAGTFVVAAFPDGERRRVDDAIQTVGLVAAAVLAVAAATAWGVAGRVLRPIGQLGRTAREITETDLSRRIPVSGRDDVAAAAATFNEMLDRLEVAFSTQRRFLDDAGHELRTPITIIRGHLEVAGDDPQERAETHALVMEELDRMSRLVDELILLAKSEQPDFLRPQEIELRAFTEGLVARCRAGSDREWLTDACGRGPFVADPQRLAQAMINLAQNASRYSTPGTAIAVGSSRTDTEVRVWVRDQGPGIPRAFHQRIFERFARGPMAARHSEGSGLGLAIARAIATGHRGRLDLDSDEGRGSTFTLVLPLGTGASRQ